MPQAHSRWDLPAAGAPIVFPRRVRDDGLPRAWYRQRKWKLRGRVTRWMVRTGLRQINAAYAHTGSAAFARTTVGRLELIDAAHAADRYGMLQPRHSELGRWIVLDEYELALCARAAVRILERIWTPEFIETASLGGRVSIRPPTYTPSQYQHVQHLPQQLAAEVLGCSVRTVKRLAALARATGGAVKAAALVYATRVRRLFPETAYNRGQITKAWGVPAEDLQTLEQPNVPLKPPKQPPQPLACAEVVKSHH
jgi:hypothetical protein